MSFTRTKPEICEHCKKEFARRWLSGKKQWSQVNDIHYWTEGKEWKGCRIVCRACLNYWFEKDNHTFHELISPKRKATFHSYRTDGTLKVKE